MHTCNENQIDTLFILSLSRQLPLHVSGIFVAHHQEEYYIYIYTASTNCCMFTVYLLMLGHKYARNI